MIGNLTPDSREAVVRDIAKLAKEKYFFPDKGEEIARFLLEKFKQGGYNAIVDAHELALTLKLDLRRISNDQHWDVLYDAKQATVEFGDLEDEDSEEELAQWVEQSRKQNFGFEKVERLKGNIGYIELRQFGFPEYAGDTAVAAMGFVANCDVLILDLRQNHGGEAEMVQLMASYLFDPELRHLNTIYSRPEDEYWQFWTLPYVPGKRLPDIPVYLLTSNATFSAAEEFVYDLKHMGRATIVGEVTGGGGHMVDLAVIQDNYQVLIPFAGAINPITKSNWEGIGVKPHIPVPREEALKAAHLHALNHLIEKCVDPQQLRSLEWELEIAQSQYASPVIVDKAALSGYTGQYGQRFFAVEDGFLTYTSQQAVVWKLIPMVEGRFRLNEDIKFAFILDEKGMADAVDIAYKDGRPGIRVEKNL